MTHVALLQAYRMHDMLTSPVMGKCPNIEQHPIENVGAHRSNVFMFLFQGVQPNSECLDPTRRETISPSLGMFFCREVIRLFPTEHESHISCPLLNEENSSLTYIVYVEVLHLFYEHSKSIILNSFK